MLADNALTTIEKAKSFLGMDLASTEEDETLIFNINSISSAIERYCDRTFRKRVIQEFKQGRDSSRLILDHYPVLDLLTLVIGETEVDLTKIRVLSDTGMLFRPEGFPADIKGGRFLYPKHDEHAHNIYVEYVSGFVLPKDETPDEPRTLPADIELACLRMLRLMKKDKEVSEGNNLVLKRETIGDWVGEYEPENKSTSAKLDYFDPDIVSLIEPYRKKSEFYV
jgi:hypothetical protein